jgi:hypothetical protein
MNMEISPGYNFDASIYMPGEMPIRFYYCDLANRILTD